METMKRSVPVFGDASYWTRRKTRKRSCDSAATSNQRGKWSAEGGESQRKGWWGRGLQGAHRCGTQHKSTQPLQPGCC